MFTSILIAFMVERIFRDSYSTTFADICKVIIYIYNSFSAFISWNSLKNVSLSTLWLPLNIVCKQMTE